MLPNLLGGLQKWAENNAHEHIYLSDPKVCSLCSVRGTRWIDIWEEDN
jgi:hypothetical protein